MKPRPFIPLALATAASILWPGFAPRTAFAAEPRRVAISFEVHELKEENVEGPDVLRSYFKVGDKWMVFGVPRGCRLTTGNEFVLLPTEPGLEGEIHVRPSPFAPELNLTDNAPKYLEATSKQIPLDARDIKVQPPLTDPYPYNGWQSLGFAYTYTFYGRALCRTVSYINLDRGAQVMVTVEGSSADADKMDKMAHNFIGSWWTMEPRNSK